MATTSPDHERFLANVDIVGDCWLWKGGLRDGRYGTFWLNGKCERAHRAALILNRVEIPPGKVVHHTCGQTRCVYPGHLQITSIRENTNREPHSNASRSHCPRGHPYDYHHPTKPRRECRRCKAMHQRAYYARKKAAGATPRLTP